VTPRPDRRHGRRLKGRRGALLAEHLLFLVIVALSIAAAAGMFGTSMANSRAASFVDQVEKLVAGAGAIRTGVGLGADGADLLPAIASRRLLPAGIAARVGASMVYRHSYGGVLALTAARSGRGFDLRLTAVPSRSCIPLVAKLAGAPATAVFTAAALPTYRVALDQVAFANPGSTMAGGYVTPEAACRQALGVESYDLVLEVG
jgi:hypothetical protein